MAPRRRARRSTRRRKGWRRRPMLSRGMEVGRGHARPYRYSYDLRRLRGTTEPLAPEEEKAKAELSGPSRSMSERTTFRRTSTGDWPRSRPRFKPPTTVRSGSTEGRQPAPTPSSPSTAKAAFASNAASCVRPGCLAGGDRRSARARGRHPLHRGPDKRSLTSKAKRNRPRLPSCTPVSVSEGLRAHGPSP